VPCSVGQRGFMFVDDRLFYLLTVPDVPGVRNGTHNDPRVAVIGPEDRSGIAAMKKLLEVDTLVGGLRPVDVDRRRTPRRSWWAVENTSRRDGSGAGRSIQVRSVGKDAARPDWILDRTPRGLPRRGAPLPVRSGPHPSRPHVLLLRL